MWNIEKIVSKGDYNYAIVRNHPKRTKNDYVLEHRIVVENNLGRILKDDEIVHHINEIKKDNRVNNLEVMKIEDHAKLHGIKKGNLYSMLCCPWCNEIFEVEYRQTHLAKKSNLYTSCCRSCRGSFSRYIQLNGKDKFVLDMLSKNVIDHYRKFNKGA